MNAGNLKSAIDVLNEFKDNNLYGSVEVKFQAGRVVLVRKTTTEIPSDNQRTWGESGMRNDATHNSR